MKKLTVILVTILSALIILSSISLFNAKYIASFAAEFSIYAGASAYTLNLDANGGYFTDTHAALKVVSKVADTSFGVYDELRHKNEALYYFLGWGTSPTAVQPLYKPGETIVATGKVTHLYAIWGAKMEFIMNNTQEDVAAGKEPITPTKINNEHVNLKMHMESGHYERLFIPLYGLEPNTYYSITFDYSASGDYHNFAPGVFGWTIISNEEFDDYMPAETVKDKNDTSRALRKRSMQEIFDQTIANQDEAAMRWRAFFDNFNHFIDEGKEDHGASAGKFHFDFTENPLSCYDVFLTTSEVETSGDYVNCAKPSYLMLEFSDLQDKSDSYQQLLNLRIDRLDDNMTVLDSDNEETTVSTRLPDLATYYQNLGQNYTISKYAYGAASSGQITHLEMDFFSPKTSDYLNPEKWDAHKNVVKHLNQDELTLDGTALSSNETISFTNSMNSIKYRGWIALMGTPGTFGYQIDYQDPVFSSDFSGHTENAVIESAQTNYHADTGARFKITVDISNLEESLGHTVRFLYKTTGGTIYMLKRLYLNSPFSSKLPSIHPDRVDNRTDDDGKGFYSENCRDIWYHELWDKMLVIDSVTYDHVSYGEKGPSDRYYGWVFRNRRSDITYTSESQDWPHTPNNNKWWRKDNITAPIDESVAPTITSPLKVNSILLGCWIADKYSNGTTVNNVSHIADGIFGYQIGNSAPVFNSAFSSKTSNDIQAIVNTARNCNQTATEASTPFGSGVRADVEIPIGDLPYGVAYEIRLLYKSADGTRIDILTEITVCKTETYIQSQTVPLVNTP